MNVKADFPYHLVMTKAEAIRVLKSLEGKQCALDFETTALHPSSGRVRLTNLMCDEFEKPVLFDHYFCGHFKDLAPYYKGVFWFVYNAKFELRWFDEYVPNEVEVMDVDFMAKAKLGGHHTSLARMVKRDLGITMDKDLQNSDWHKKELTPEQYGYAADDAMLTWRLVKLWKEELKDHAIGPNYDIEFTSYPDDTCWIQQDCVRPTIECEETGMILDVDYHAVNVAKWKDRQDRAYRYVRKYTPSNVLNNLRSRPQVSNFLKTQLGENVLSIWPKTEKTKQLSLGQDTLKPIIRRVSYPFSRWLTAYMLFSYYDKYLSTYGETLITIQTLSDKISYRLNISQAATKRYSSSSINIQNLPRAAYVRNAFHPPEGYRYFVTADYSGIEIRTLAELSGDRVLLRDAIYGNMHATMAAEANQIPEDKFLARLDTDANYKEMRSKAKAGTFRITYGAGSGAVADSLNSSVDYAEEFIRKWAARYPDAYNYRNKMFDVMKGTGYLPMIDGSTVFVRRPDRTLPVAANYPVQGAAALVMMAAMNRVYCLRNEMSSKELIVMCATVHDEIVLAVKTEGHINTAKDILEKGMRMGWLDVFPDTDTTNLIESGHGRRWGECK